MTGMTQPRRTRSVPAYLQILGYAVAVAAIALLFGSMYWFARAGSAARWQGQVAYIADPGPAADGHYTLRSVPGAVPASVTAGGPDTTITITVPADQVATALRAGRRLTCHTTVTDALNTDTGGKQPRYAVDHCLSRP